MVFIHGEIHDGCVARRGGAGEGLAARSGCGLTCASCWYRPLSHQGCRSCGGTALPGARWPFGSAMDQGSVLISVLALLCSAAQTDSIGHVHLGDALHSTRIAYLCQVSLVLQTQVEGISQPSAEAWPCLPFPFSASSTQPLLLRQHAISFSLPGHCSAFFLSVAPVAAQQCVRSFKSRGWYQC